MQISGFLAVDESGRRLCFDEKWQDNRVILTLKKETLSGVRKLRALSGLTEAKAGDEGFYLLPRNINMMGDFLTYFSPREDLTYTYNKPVLALFGIKRPGLCALVRIERTYKFSLEIACRDGVYTLSVLYDFTNHDPIYRDIHIEVVFLPETTGYSGMAAAERELRLSRGEIEPLREKCRREAVDYARRYPLIRIRMAWKPSPSPVLHQTNENEPPVHVACTFERVRDIAEALKREGLPGAELQLVGWNCGGHDGRFPQLFPVEPLLGGYDELQKTIAYVKSLGYRISLHTNLIDSYEIADSFTWDDVCVNRDGSLCQVGHYSGGLAYHVCPIRQLKNYRRDMPDVIKLNTNGLHFIDVISIVEPDDCHSAAHPCTTADGIRIAREIMAQAKDDFGAFSSEGAFDFALHDLDYALYISFGDGFGAKVIPFADRIIPFYELVYHGIILYNPISPTINYTIKSPRDRMLFFLRGGKPTFYFYSKFRTGGAKNWMGDIDLTADTDEELSYSVRQIIKAHEDYAPYADLQLKFFCDYEIHDNGVEVAVYEDGTRIVGNTADSECIFEGKRMLPYDIAILERK